MTAQDEAAGAAVTTDDEARRRHRLVLMILPALLMGMFLSALDQTVVATSMRTIADDLHGLALQAWVATAYLITSTVSTPLYGKLSDLYGRKPLYLAAILLFLVGSAACTFAQSMYQLAALRALQGLGAGGLMTLAFAITADLIPPRERARYQSWFLLVWISSSLLGPVLGGILVGSGDIVGITGWRWVFLVNLPIGVVALALVVKLLRLPRPGRDGVARIDYGGALAMVVATVPLLLIAEQGQQWGWASPAALACYLVAALGLAAFVYFGRRLGEQALIPLRLFGVQTFRVSVIVSMAVGAGMFGAMSAAPLFAQLAKGVSPTGSGLLMLPMMLGMVVSTALSGKVIARSGRYKMLPVIGCACTAVGMFGFAVVTLDTPLWVPAVLLFVLGIGLGNCTQTLTVAAQNAVPLQDIGTATAAVMFFRQIAGTLGVGAALSALFGALPGAVTDALPQAAGRPDFVIATHDTAVVNNPDNAAFFQFLRGSRAMLSDSSFLDRLDPRLAWPFEQGFSSATGLVFLVGGVLMLLTTLYAMTMRELPLREVSPAQLAESE